MLGPILQTKDDIDQFRCLFLNSNFDDSLRMIDPRMFEVQTGTWKEVQITEEIETIEFICLFVGSINYFSSSTTKYFVFRPSHAYFYMERS